MKRLLLMAVVAFGLAGLARAGEETVSYKSGDESVSSFLATPAGSGPHPALVVIQE